MDLSNLKPAKGSVKKNKRLGRGEGSTRGGTSTRGHKGQKSRSGYSKKVGFEGGQQPLQRRVPKFGFKNINRVEYKGINLDTIQAVAENKKLSKIDKDVLVSSGLASKNDLIKILGRGELKTKIEIKADAFSSSAKAAVEKQGGTWVVNGEVATKEKGAPAKNKKPKSQKTENKKEEPVKDSKVKDGEEIEKTEQKEEPVAEDAKAD